MTSKRGGESSCKLHSCNHYIRRIKTRSEARNIYLPSQWRLMVGLFRGGIAVLPGFDFALQPERQWSVLQALCLCGLCTHVFWHIHRLCTIGPLGLAVCTALMVLAMVDGTGSCQCHPRVAPRTATTAERGGFRLTWVEYRSLQC